MVERAEAVNIKPANPIVKNKSYQFILPLLGKTRSYFDNTINTYLIDLVNKTELNNKIFVNTSKYDDLLTKVEYFNQYYQLEDYTYMFVYDIPEEFEEDYIKFYDGKYSLLSDRAKELICSFSPVRPMQNSMVYKVLFRTKDQRERIEELIGETLHPDAEVCSIPNMTKETYNIHPIKRGVQLLKEDEDILSN